MGEPAALYTVIGEGCPPSLGGHPSSEYKTITIEISGEIVIVLDYGRGVYVAKAEGGCFGTPENKLRQTAEARAVDLFAKEYKRKGELRKRNKVDKELLRHKTAQKKRAVTYRANAARKSNSTNKRRAAIEAWVDMKLKQRSVGKMPKAIHLAKELLKHGSDFRWPTDCDPVNKDT